MKKELPHGLVLPDPASQEDLTRDAEKRVRSDKRFREAGEIDLLLTFAKAVCFAFRILESSESCSTINQHVLVVTQNLWLAEPDRFVFCCANFPHLCFFVMHMILFAIYRYILCTETVQNHSW